MANNFETNAQYLLETGAEATTYLPAGSLYIENLDPVTAVFIAHHLTKKLDNLYGCSPSYSDDWQELVERTKDYKESGYLRKAFGETRPAHAHLAVSVSLPSNRNGLSRLRADRRNKFSDHPELQGERLIHLGLIVVLEQIELPFVDEDLNRLLQ